MNRKQKIKYMPINAIFMFSYQNFYVKTKKYENFT